LRLKGVEQGGVDMSSDMVRWGGLAGVAAGVMLSRPDPRRAGRGAGSLLVEPEGLSYLTMEDAHHAPP
jgi:hypothetical protein